MANQPIEELKTHLLFMRFHVYPTSTYYAQQYQKKEIIVSLLTCFWQSQYANTTEPSLKSIWGGDGMENIREEGSQCT